MSNHVTPIYSKEFKSSINNTIGNLLGDMLYNKTPFSVVVTSKGWENPLPEHLIKQEYFIIQIQEQTMDDSYFDEDMNCIIIQTEFNNQPNSIMLYPECVKGIMDISMQIPILMKPFAEDVLYKHIEVVKLKGIYPLKQFEEGELTPEVKHSLNCFVKNNPDMFKGE